MTLQDPYRPPRADLAPDGLAGRRGTGTFSIREAVIEGWSATWANFPLWLGAGIVWLLALMVSYLTVVGAILVAPVLYWGGIVFALRMLRGGAKLSDLFSGFARFGAVLGPMLGLSVIMIALSLAANALSSWGQYRQDVGLQGIGLLVYVAFTLLVLPRLMFAPFYLVDREVGPVHALSLSWNATRELKLKVALLIPMLFFIGVAGLLAFGIGVIPAQVVAYLMIASAYRQLEGDPPYER